jgi:alkylhydroperoxidase/carboxymuconolactone decarboxylase family protein YurZ
MNAPSDAPRRYQIVFRGECGDVLAGVFSDVAIESRLGYTRVVAVVRDESEFYGLLGRFADLALRPVSLTELGADDAKLSSASNGTGSRLAGPDLDATTWLARVAARDPAALAMAGDHLARDLQASVLDAKSRALIRLAGLVGHGGEESAAVYEHQVMTAVRHGASAEEIAAALMALFPTVGAGRVAAAAALIWPVLGEATGVSPADRLGEEDQAASGSRHRSRAIRMA